MWKVGQMQWGGGSTKQQEGSQRQGLLMDCNMPPAPADVGECTGSTPPPLRPYPAATPTPIAAACTMHKVVIPDWLRALTLGKLPAVAVAAAGPGPLSSWGLAGYLLRPCLLPPSDLSHMQPVCAPKLQVRVHKIRLSVQPVCKSVHIRHACMYSHIASPCT